LHRQLQKQTEKINALAFSAKGRWLASGSEDRTLVIWDATNGKPMRMLKGKDLTVSSIAFSLDGSPRESRRECDDCFVGSANGNGQPRFQVESASLLVCA
jgi:WD40 repeat protein